MLLVFMIPIIIINNALEKMFIRVLFYQIELLITILISFYDSALLPLGKVY